MEIQEATTHFSDLMARVAAGEEVVITRHGSPVARMVPIHRVSTPEQRLTAIESLRRFSKQQRLAGLSVRDMIDAGRH